MFKWIIIILIAFFSAWIFLKKDFPDFIRDSRFADICNVIVYPVEKSVYAYFPELSKNVKSPTYYKLVYDQLHKFKGASEERDRQVVYFFYDPLDMNSRMIVSSLNRLITQYPYNKNKIDYLYIAVTDSPGLFQDFLKQFYKINFIPYYMSRADYNSVVMMFERNNLYPHTELPRTIFKNITQGRYIEVQSGFFTKGRLESFIEQKI